MFEHTGPSNENQDISQRPGADKQHDGQRRREYRYEETPIGNGGVAADGFVHEDMLV